MKKTHYIVWALVASSLFFGSCNRKVTRIDNLKVTDLSGRWNDTDSRLVSAEMITDCLGAPWLTNFYQEKGGKKPVVIAGMVTNKSHEHIESEPFIKDLERAFIKTQKVRLVQGGEKREEVRAERADQQNNASISTMKKWGLEIGADYMLQGSINSFVDSYKSKKYVLYKVNLELTHIQTNEVVWIGDKEIKKYIKN